MIVKRVIPALLLPLLLAQAAPPAPATGTEAAGAGRDAQAAQSNAFLAPYIDDQTVLVAHLDMSAVDTGAIEGFVTRLFDQMKMAADDPTRAGIPVAKSAANVFLARFKQLGGRHVFLVLNQSDIYPDMSGPAVILKIEPGGDAKGILALLNATMGEDDGVATLVRGDALILASTSGARNAAGGGAPTMKRLENMKGEARPDLAFHATDDAFELVAALTADQRRVMHDFLPTLPVEMGGGSTDLLTQDVQSVSLRVHLPPTPSAGIQFTMRPGSSGQPLVQLITRLRDTVLADKDFNQQLDMNPDLKPMAAGIRAMTKEVLTPQLITGKDPALGRDVVELRLTEKQIDQVTLLLAPALDRSRTQAARIQSASDARVIVQCVLIYASEHDGAMPESLDVLAQVKDSPLKNHPEILNSPDDPKHRPYVYRPWVAKLAMLTNPAETPIVWEQADEPNDGRNVGYADGHVEWTRPQAFDKLMAETEAKQKAVKPVP